MKTTLDLIRDDLLYMLDENSVTYVLNVIDHRLNINPLKMNATNEQLLEKFIEAKLVEGKSENTTKRYHNEISLFLKYNPLDLKQTSTQQIRDYLNQRKETNSKRSLNGIKNVLSSFFGWLEAEGIVSRNPVRGISRIKYRKEEENPYSQTELQMIRDACNSKRDLALIEFMYATGCRISEIVRLDRTDVNILERKLKVIGKGDKEREVYISDICAMRLMDYLNSRKDNEKPLFASTVGKRLTTDGARAMLKRIENRTTVTDIHPHRFRHTLASDLLRKGVPIEIVQIILGHEQIETTRGYCKTAQDRAEAEYRKYCA